jgi:hypothetical protein
MARGSNVESCNFRMKGCMAECDKALKPAGRRNNREGTDDFVDAITRRVAVLVTALRRRVQRQPAVTADLESCPYLVLEVGSGVWKKRVANDQAQFGHR